jgi:hypothetical protein
VSVLRDKTGLKTGTIHGYFYNLLKADTGEDGCKQLSFALRHHGASCRTTWCW